MNLYPTILAKMQSDKWQHFAAGVVLAVPVQAAFDSMLITSAVATIVGVGKEAADWLMNRYRGATHGVEWLDALATAAGGVWVAGLLGVWK